MKSFLTVSDLAVIFDVSHSTVKAWTKRGLLPVPLSQINARGRWRWRADQVAEWVEATHPEYAGRLLAVLDKGGAE